MFIRVIWLNSLIEWGWLMFIKVKTRTGTETFKGEDLSFDYEMIEEDTLKTTVFPKIRSDELVVVYSNAVMVDTLGEISVYLEDSDYPVNLPRTESMVLYVYDGCEIVGVFTRDKGDCVNWRYQE